MIWAGIRTTGRGEGVGKNAVGMIAVHRGEGREVLAVAQE